MPRIVALIFFVFISNTESAVAHSFGRVFRPVRWALKTGGERSLHQRIAFTRLGEKLGNEWMPQNELRKHLPQTKTDVRHAVLAIDMSKNEIELVRDFMTLMIRNEAFRQWVSSHMGESIDLKESIEGFAISAIYRIFYESPRASNEVEFINNLELLKVFVDRLFADSHRFAGVSLYEAAESIDSNLNEIGRIFHPDPSLDILLQDGWPMPPSYIQREWRSILLGLRKSILSVENRARGSLSPESVDSLLGPSFDHLLGVTFRRLSTIDRIDFCRFLIRAVKGFSKELIADHDLSHAVWARLILGVTEAMIQIDFELKKEPNSPDLRLRSNDLLLELSHIPLKTGGGTSIAAVARGYAAHYLTRDPNDPLPIH